jgi:hypothetical protein
LAVCNSATEKLNNRRLAQVRPAVLSRLNEANVE